MFLHCFNALSNVVAILGYCTYRNGQKESSSSARLLWSCVAQTLQYIHKPIKYNLYLHGELGSKVEEANNVGLPRFENL